MLGSLGNWNRIPDLSKELNEKYAREEFLESFQGWNAYAKWANSYNTKIFFIKTINIID